MLPPSVMLRFCAVSEQPGAGGSYWESQMKNRPEWLWMPHPGHLIVAHDCRFHLNTWVPSDDSTPGGFIVSTVGEYLPDSVVREIHANVRGIQLSGRGDERLADFMEKCGYVEIGCGRLYETMVFRAEPASPGEGEECCPFRMADSSALDVDGYNDPDAAALGHYAMCEKWHLLVATATADGGDA